MYNIGGNPVPDSEDDEESSGSVEGWIQWFCSLESHDFFCEVSITLISFSRERRTKLQISFLLLKVDEEYMRDNFNLHGLRPKVRQYDRALHMILESEPPEEGEPPQI